MSRRKKRERCVNCRGWGFLMFGFWDHVLLTGWPCPDCHGRGYYRENQP